MQLKALDLILERSLEKVEKKFQKQIQPNAMQCTCTQLLDRPSRYLLIEILNGLFSP